MIILNFCVIAVNESSKRAARSTKEKGASKGPTLDDHHCNIVLKVDCLNESHSLCYQATASMRRRTGWRNDVCQASPHSIAPHIIIILLYSMRRRVLRGVGILTSLRFVEIPPRPAGRSRDAPLSIIPSQTSTTSTYQPHSRSLAQCRKVEANGATNAPRPQRRTATLQQCFVVIKSSCLLLLIISAPKRGLASAR